jgi:type IV secretory pathway VirB2 component (pilin)
MNTNLVGRAAATARRFKTRAAAAVGTVAMLPALAFAQAADPAAAITSELTGIKGTVSGILVVLAAVVGLMLLWSYIKRAK